MKTVLLGDVSHKIKDLPLEIIDGDRGTNYPNNHELLAAGHCLFLSAKNVTADGFDFSQTQFISSEKDAILRKGKLQRFDIALTTRGTVGNVAFYDDTVLFDHIRINSGMVIIRCDTTMLLPRYFYYILKSRLFLDQVLNFRSGSAQPQLPIRDMQNIKLPLPSIEEQKEVINQIGSVGDKIEVNRRMNETLEQMGQALFKHYFINNPESKTWTKSKFSDFTDVITGKGSTKSVLAEGGKYPLYGAGGIMGSSDNYLLDEPVIITGRVGTLGRIQAVTDKAWFSDNVLIMRPKLSYFGLVYYLVKSFDFVSMNRGSSQPLVTQTDLKNHLVKSPDKKTLLESESQFQAVFNLMQKNEKEIITLGKLRDSLLPRLISGKIKI